MLVAMGTTQFLRADLSLPRDLRDAWLATALDGVDGPFEGWMEHDEEDLATGTVGELLAMLDEASDHFTYAANDDVIELRAFFSGDILVDFTAALARSFLAAAVVGATGTVLLADAGTRRASVLTLKGKKAKLGAPRANAVTPAELAESAETPRGSPPKVRSPKKSTSAKPARKAEKKSSKPRR